MAGSTTVIFGLGITGLSCVRYLHGREALVVVDTRPDPPGLAELTEDYPSVTVRVGVDHFDWSAADRIVVSPGVSLNSPLLEGLAGDPRLVSDIDLFCEATAAPVLAITGTNGKSTVTSLAAHLLRAGGLNAVAGGNLGEPALDLLDYQADVYVLELSSFQLERMAPQKFVAAAILNVTEDHLDRHGGMSEYAAAKQRIYRNCELAVASRDDARTLPAAEVPLVTFGSDAPRRGHWGIRSADGGRWLACGEQLLIESSDLPLAGRHNEQNVLAALALVGFAELADALLIDATKSYRGLRHRCERVGLRAGVSWINDSKATNVGATQAALRGFGEAAANILLIAGGDGKGADFDELREPVRKHVKALILLGRDAPKLAAALSGTTDIHRVESMAEAVDLAVGLAERGDLVLLSPACASLDMYRNFEARGDDFTSCVEALAA